MSEPEYEKQSQLEWLLSHVNPIDHGPLVAAYVQQQGILILAPGTTMHGCVLENIVLFTRKGCTEENCKMERCSLNCCTLPSIYFDPEKNDDMRTPPPRS